MDLPENLRPGHGDPDAITPTLDKLASRGARFTNAFTTAGVGASF